DLRPRPRHRLLGTLHAPDRPPGHGPDPRPDRLDRPAFPAGRGRRMTRPAATGRDGTHVRLSGAGRSRRLVPMARSPEGTLAFRTLYGSPVVAVSEYRCRACRGGPAAEEYSGGNHVVLLRRGAFCKHFGRRSVTADVNQAVFFSEGSTYRVSHPAACGD